MTERARFAGWLAFFSIAYLASTWDLLSAPDVLLGSVGDAIHNIFTFLYQLRFGASWTHFQGMSFPFGEHVVMTDGQPLLVWLLRVMGLGGTQGPSLGFMLGLHNFLLLIEPPIAAYFLFRIFRALRLSATEALVAGASLAFMSPQILRWGGHYALGHVVALPLALWLQVRRYLQVRGYFNMRARRGWGFGIAFNSLAWGCIHPYYLPILVSMSLVLEGALQWRRESTWFRRFAPIAVQCVVPLVLFLTFMKLTDPITDRGTAVGVFNATFAGIFLTRWRDLLGTIDPSFRSLFAIPQFEGVVPLGLSALPFFFFTVFVGAIIGLRQWRGQGLQLRSQRRRRLNSGLYLLWAMALLSLLALIFSFGFHLKGHLGLVLGHIGPIRQFRSVGRFAWVFALGFSIVSLAAAIRFLRWSAITGKLSGAACQGLIWILLFSQAGESVFWYQWNLRELRTRISRLENSSFPVLNRILVRDFQAVLPLPYFHFISGGPDDLPADEATLRQSLLLSLATGLPNLGSHDMWPSLSQAHLLVGAIHRGESREKWLESLSPEGDLLVWIGSRSLLTPAEETLARLAEPVDAVEGQGLFRLRLSSLRHEVLRHRVKETREAHRL